MQLESYNETDVSPGRYVFIRDAEPHEGGGFKAGQVVTLNAASAARWSRRDAVVPEGDAPTERDVETVNDQADGDEATQPRRGRKPRKANP